MTIPRVYGAINAVAAELAKCGLAKSHINLDDQYAYRGIDDLYNRLGPILAANKLCILPRVLERGSSERSGSIGEILLHVTVRAAFDFVSAEDGSVHVVEAFGEALDASDKGTAKAMQSAFKYAILQAFCVPLGTEDADAASPKLKPLLAPTQPVQGWEQWSRDIIDMIGGCESREALDTVQERHRSTLASLSRERPDLYAELGKVMAGRRAALMAPPKRAQKPARAKAAPSKTAAAKAEARALADA